MTTIYRGVVECTRETDAEGYRTFHVTYQVESDSKLDGPQTVADTEGIPSAGDIYQFGNESDEWAVCLATGSERRAPSNKSTGPARFWYVERHFSNKPVSPQQQRCQDTQITDPMQEPAKVSWGSIHEKEEATRDRFGQRILNSAHEVVRGAQNEWPVSNSKFSIEQNVANLERELCESMRNGVNAFWIWGYPPRTVRLADFDADKLYYGNCYRYFKRKFHFEVKWKGWDRDLLDEGKKVLKGHWSNASGTGTTPASWILDDIDGMPPDPDNPSHFIRYQDRHGNVTSVVLDGEGKPATRVRQSAGIELVGRVSSSPGDYRLSLVVDDDLEFEVDDEVELTGVIPSLYDGLYTVSAVTSGTICEITPKDQANFPGFLAEDGEDGWAINLDFGSGAPGKIHVEKFDGVDFSILGLPIDLEE